MGSYRILIIVVLVAVIAASGIAISLYDSSDDNRDNTQTSTTSSSVSANITTSTKTNSSILSVITNTSSTIKTNSSTITTTINSKSTTTQQPEDMFWNSVNDFVYQLQNIDLVAIGNTDFDLVVMDYSEDGTEETRFTFEQIITLKNSPGGPKLVLAYMSIGEAEDYRWYWNNKWDTDKDGFPDLGAPLWLGPSNPDWLGNYKVKYWEPGWQSIIYGSPTSYLDKIIEAGFDGVYLDIIDAYEFWGPDGESGLNRDSAEQEMVDFVKAIANYARVTKGETNFGIFPQNGESLSSYPEYVTVVTGIGKEDMWYDDNTHQPSTYTDEVISNLDVFKQEDKLVLVNRLCDKSAVDQ